jgi:hypothetical protein
MAELIGTGSDSTDMSYRFVVRVANSAPQSAPPVISYSSRNGVMDLPLTFRNSCCNGFCGLPLSVGVMAVCAFQQVRKPVRNIEMFLQTYFSCHIFNYNFMFTCNFITL